MTEAEMGFTQSRLFGMRPLILRSCEPNNAESRGFGGSNNSMKRVVAGVNSFFQVRYAVVPRNLPRISSENSLLFILQMKDRREPPLRTGSIWSGFQLLTSSQIQSPDASSMRKSTPGQTLFPLALPPGCLGLVLSCSITVFAEEKSNSIPLSTYRLTFSIPSCGTSQFTIIE